MSTSLELICNQFNFHGNFKNINPYGDGHINDTYKVTYLNADGHVTHYILQRVNHLIFKNTEGLMENIQNVTSYLSDMITEEENLDGFDVLELVKTRSKTSFYKDPEGNYWRAYIFVEGATGHTFAEDTSMLYEAGKAFGQFQRLLQDYPVLSLHETIKDFHHTQRRYETFMTTYQENPCNRAETCMDQIHFIQARKSLTSIIIEALDSKAIPYRVTHNDTKINNVLLDDTTGVGRCVIDLDTVMPGSALYDFGDAIRSCGSNLEEDSEDLDQLVLDLERFEAYTKGFLEVMGHSLTPKELELLPSAAIVMTLECGIRFLTDHIDGDHYFKVHRPNHNLSRAKNQFRFVEVMEENMATMKAIVNKYATVN